MKDTMPDISFERSMNHNYMILSKCDFFGKGSGGEMDYRMRMLLENNIPGLLAVTHRLINGESRYYYEINSLQSLDRLYDKKAIKYDELRRLLSGCVSLFERLEEYLLDGTQIIIKPGLIYVDVEKMEPYFVCYPEYEGDVRLSFMEFVDDLLTRIDHTDERAVMLGYQVYRYTRNPNYVISGIGKMIEHAVADMAGDGKAYGGARDTAKEVAAESAYEKPYEKPVENVMHREHGERRPPVRHQEEVPDSGGFAAGKNIAPAYGIRQEKAADSGGFANRGIYEGKNGGESESTGRGKSRGNAELIGGIACLLVSLCIGLVVLVGSLTGIVKLSGKSGLYMCGAAGMLFAAAALSFICWVKKKMQDKDIENLGAEYEDDDDAYYSRPQGFGRDCGTSVPVTDYHEEHEDQFQYQKPQCQDRQYQNPPYQNSPYQNQQQSCSQTGSQYHGESPGTVCLGEIAVEERVLFGRMDGKEVSIKLDRLPMTVGKMASMADFVINDNAVSKMHARFEERDGRVYVCDLNSTNGTVRNGVLLGVNQSVKLEPGDRLRFGRTCFTYS